MVSGTRPARRTAADDVDTHEQFDAAVRARGPPSPLRVAYQLTHHRADAEDVVQAALRPTLTDSTEEASTP